MFVTSPGRLTNCISNINVCKPNICTSDQEFLISINILLHFPDKIDLRLAPGVESMDKLIAEVQSFALLTILQGKSGTFDFVFIDADKPNYDHYYERALKLVRKGAIIAIDNVLWHGKVLHTEQDEETKAIATLNKKVGEWIMLTGIRFSTTPE